MASGAPVYVSRAESALGVSPWSASETSTASSMRLSAALGGRRVTSKYVSSVSDTLPMSSFARSRPATVMLSAVDEPIQVCRASPLLEPSVAIGVDLLGCPLARQLVLGQPAGWRVW